MDAMNDSFLKPSEVAQSLRCDKRTVHSLIRAGRLQAVRIGARIVRIPRSKFDAFLAERIGGGM